MKRPGETWKPVADFEGRYEVSSLGRVRSILFGGCRILKPHRDNWGYLKCNLWHKDGYQLNCKIHSLVCAAFVGPRPSGLHVNHKNGIKEDNRKTNLEYMSHKMNMAHAKKLGLVRRAGAIGVRNPLRKNASKT